MSYILDALKKSDKERQQGEVPDLQTVQESAAPKPRRLVWWHYLLLLGLFLNVVVLTWWLQPSKPQPDSGQLSSPVEQAPAPAGVPDTDDKKGLGAEAQAPAVENNPAAVSPKPEGAAGTGGAEKMPAETSAPVVAAEKTTGAPAGAPAESGADTGPAKTPALENSPAAEVSPKPEGVTGTGAAGKMPAAANAPPVAAEKPSNAPAGPPVRSGTGAVSAKTPAAAPTAEAIQTDTGAEKEITEEPLLEPGGVADSPGNADSEVVEKTAGEEGQPEEAPAAGQPPAGRPLSDQGQQRLRTPNAAKQAAPAAKAKDILEYSQLPLAEQQSLPELSISLLFYSHTPASRKVSINGRMYHEGESISNELTLEEIVNDGIILNHKGKRFRMGVF